MGGREGESFQKTQLKEELSWHLRGVLTQFLTIPFPLSDVPTKTVNNHAFNLKVPE